MNEGERPAGTLTWTVGQLGDAALIKGDLLSRAFGTRKYFFPG